MGRRSGLGEFEQKVLLCILRLDERAFAPDLVDELASSAAKKVTRGALYSTLNRLEQKGWLEWRAEEPGPDRSGQIRRRFHVTESGLHELREARNTMLDLWAGLEQLLSRDRSTR